MSQLINLIGSANSDSNFMVDNYRDSSKNPNHVLKQKNVQDTDPDLRWLELRQSFAESEITSQLDFDLVMRWLLRDKYQVFDLDLGGQNFVNQVKLLSVEMNLSLIKDLEDLVSGVPLAYVIGWVSFAQCRIDLRYHTLVPRPETEFWVQQLIDELGQRWVKNTSSRSRVAGSKAAPEETTTPSDETKLRILDLCCGSGCVGVALLSAAKKGLIFNSLNCDFIDLDSNALLQTQCNCELNQIPPESYNLIWSNLFAALKHGSNRYDLILANPPYVDRSAMSKEQLQELRHEPDLALFAAQQGLAVIRRILAESKRFLAKKGELIIEFGKGQEQQISEIAVKNGWEIKSLQPDQYGVIRWIRLGLTTESTSHRQS